MALDGLLLNAVVQELQRCVGGRIGKIYQPVKSDIVMHLRNRGWNGRLLISANPTYPRIHFTDRVFPNPPEAPMFCMLMRKHFENGIIESIEQAGMERMIIIRVKKQDEIGDTGTKSMIIELMGRHSNIIITDPSTNTIVDSIHHVTPAISSYRTVMPGFSYVSPPDQNKLHPISVTQETFMKLFQNTLADQAEDVKSTADAQPSSTADERKSLSAGHGAQESVTDKTENISADVAIIQTGKLIQQWLVRQFSGISPLIAAEIVHRSIDRKMNQITSNAVWESFTDILQQVRTGEYQPQIIESGHKTYFYIVELTHVQGDTRYFNSISECLEAYYGDKAIKDVVKQRTADLLRLIQNEKNKNINKLEKLEESLKEAQDADQYRIIGELLTASMHLMQKGDREVQIVNYYDEDQKMITAALDPQLSPSENVQRYFKKYTKLKKSISVLHEQMDDAQKEIAYLDTILQQLSSADLRDIDEIREELITQGYIRERNTSTRKQKNKKKDLPTPTMFTSSEGIPIYVGKNNTQNDFLTNKLARSNDTWLHTKDIPGSHVVIKSDSYGKQTLEEAAQLAAYFSQAKESSSVPVDYTLIKHVRKPNGAKPGFVIYDHQKTLIVTPDFERIAKLKETAK